MLPIVLILTILTVVCLGVYFFLRKVDKVYPISQRIKEIEDQKVGLTGTTRQAVMLAVILRYQLDKQKITSLKYKTITVCRNDYPYDHLLTNPHLIVEILDNKTGQQISHKRYIKIARKLLK